jgi:hypothetical protein
VVLISGHSRFIKKITVEVSTRKLTRKDNQPTVETSNVTVQDQFSELPKKGISGQQKFVHKESVKHIVKLLLFFFRLLSYATGTFLLFIRVSPSVLAEV